MAHDHHHDDSTGYYLEQLGSIAIAGVLGVVAVMMWRQGMLNFILAEQFHPFVLAGGIALLVAVVVRAVTLWLSTGAQPALANGHVHEHQHDHDCHDHTDCGHDHHHHDHDHVHAHDPEHIHAEVVGTAVDAQAGHDHGHDHGWNSWRYAILLLPVALYFLNLPNQGFSQARIAAELQSRGSLGDSGMVHVAAKGDKVLGLDFKELDRAASTPALRAYFEGQRGWLEGQFVPIQDNRKVFTLVRFKITCCAADSVQLNLAIVSPENISEIKPLDWVRAEGQIQFRKIKDKEEYMPVLQLGSPDDVRILERPPSNPYIQ